MLSRGILPAFLAVQSALADSGICGLGLQSGSSFFPSCSGFGTNLQTSCLLEGGCESKDNEIIIIHASKQSQQWSIPPKCIQSVNGTEEYCLFTSTKFAGNRGISILTTPAKAEKILQLRAFTDPNAHVGVNHEPNPPYEARSLPGRGIGLIANKTLYRGDHIFSNTPAMMVEEWVFTEFSWNERLPLQKLGIKSLPSALESGFMALHGHFGGDAVEDKFNTNAFAVEVGDDGEEAAFNIVMPEISRLNHDCRPNAHYYFDPYSLTHHVHAIRTILPGEELTISYIDPAQTQGVRLDALKASWGFDCNCAACNAPGPVAYESDERIKQLIELQETLATKRRIAEPAMGEFLVSLYEQERLYGPIAEAYSFAAHEYNAAGDFWRARKYARLGIEAGILYGGPHDDDVLNLEDLLENPEGHWSAPSNKTAEG